MLDHLRISDGGIEAEIDSHDRADRQPVDGVGATSMASVLRSVADVRIADLVLDAVMTPVVALMPMLHKQSDGSVAACQGIASALDDPP